MTWRVGACAHLPDELGVLEKGVQGLVHRGQHRVEGLVGECEDGAGVRAAVHGVAKARILQREGAQVYDD